MTDLREYIQSIGEHYKITDPDFVLNVSRLLVNNNWYGCKPIQKEGKLLLDDTDIKKIKENITAFCRLYNSDEQEKADYLIEKLETILPQTAMLLSRYARTNKIDDKSCHYLADFLITFLPGELPESTDLEVSALMEDGYEILPKVYSDILADFVNWTHDKTKTIYKNLYFMEKYTDRTEESSAYDPDNYLSILYHLYNSEYISANDMYFRASESKNYVDTWLFLSLHFLCALRNTDLERIPHPRLMKDPETILEEIGNNTFSPDSARAIVYSIMWTLEALRLSPHKTQGTSGIGTLKFFVPESVEVHIGTLFAAAEAHYQIANEDSEKPLVRRITTYEQIARYMGDEIGDLFLEANFRSRSANKSYLQMIYILTDEILGVNDDFHVKGYMLAALARTHKGSYGDFAKTTSIYLKDAKMNGYTPEFIAKGMFERGVLSMTVSMLLKMLIGEQYGRLSVEGQTKLLKEVNLSPEDAEMCVAVMQNSMKQSIKMVTDIYSHSSREEITEILHRIGNGDAVSKTGTCMCLMTAMGKVCPHPDVENCPCCEYEISTKMTMFLMVREVKRLQEIYQNSKNERERQRCKAMVKDIILPCVNEILHAMDEMYGLNARKTLEKIIEETA